MPRFEKDKIVLFPSLNPKEGWHIEKPYPKWLELVLEQAEEQDITPEEIIIRAAREIKVSKEK